MMIIFNTILTYFHFCKKKLLGSLKILNLSFCKKLHSVGDFDQLLALERLILRHCIGLVDVWESIGQCVELVLIDLSYCKKLEKLPENIGMLKKVKTVLLDGCNLGESRIKNMDMDSLELSAVNNIGTNRAFVGAIPHDLKLFAMSLPRSLVTLSLPNNKLSHESFPTDFSNLYMLKGLYLDENPINYMPSCVRTLPRLEILSMQYCNKLKSAEYPPCTVRELFINPSDVHYVEKVVFDSEMSPLQLSMYRIDYTSWVHYAPWSYEIEGVVKIQPMVTVKEKWRLLGGVESLDVWDK
uniref:Uncharacterized protein n=1 Tax=Lactuca sativa TaxID=4236 RepID=A0A9R1XT04_LACSA|nr:hypothetical protein LSAT_V11C100036870 [Lactuca sativa]